MKLHRPHVRDLHVGDVHVRDLDLHRPLDPIPSIKLNTKTDARLCAPNWARNDLRQYGMKAAR